MTDNNKIGTISFSDDILTKANIGLWAFELDQGQPPRMYADDTMLGLLGLKNRITPEEIYHVWYDNIDSASYDIVSETVEKMISGVCAEVQYPWHMPGGQTMIVRCGGVRNPDYKKGIRLEGTHQNVSEVIHYEEELLAQQKTFTNFFLDTYVSAYYVNLINHSCQIYKRTKDLEKNYPDVSDYFVSLVEYINKDVHPDDREMLLSFVKPEKMMAMLRKQTDYSHIFRDISNDIEKIYRLQVIRGADKNHAAFGFIDITEELTEQTRRMNEIKTANEKLLQQKTLLDYFVSSYSSAYAVNLLDDSFEILNMRHDFSEVFKMRGSREDMLYFIDKHVHPDDREMIKKIIDKENIYQRLRNEDSFSFTLREMFGGISRVMRGIVIRGIDEYHVAVGFLDITEDIKKEKESQNELEKALSMSQSANRAKTTFLNNMSHDIRTPMNAIIGFTELAQQHADNKEQTIDYLKKISRSSDHLLSLINDVLDMSRIESGKMKLDENTENLSNIVDTIVDIMQSEADNKNLRLNVDCSEVRDFGIICDKLRLNQILLNVLSNAVKYTPNGGSIDFKVKEIPMSGSEFARYIFTIKDNGIGMSEDFLDTIFEPFTRVKSSTASGVQGTGLGMSITKNIIDLMGGRIDIKSKLGEGTEVMICINFKTFFTNENGIDSDANDSADDKEEGKFTLPSPAYFEGKKVLLVEDNELNREIATEILTSYGLTVDTAEDGMIALEKMIKAKEGDYNLIFMDLQMPILDGFESTKRIRNLKSEISKIPIVAMTANAFEEDRQAAIAAGMNEHIAKPISRIKLEETLAKYL